MSKRIITIGRQFGSNGRAIGMSLAEKLGIHCYDKDLIKIASEQMDIPYEQLKRVDEKRERPWAYQVDKDSGLNRRYRYEHIDEKLFETECEVIRHLAEREDCIIVGRCANYVLRDYERCFHVYLYAPYDDCINTIMNRYSLDEKKAEHLIRRVDKDRDYYYNYYTDEYREDMENYDLCLNTSAYSKEEILDILQFFYQKL
ncbi:MAG: AAA family ATPase [Dorea sp.]